MNEGRIKNLLFKKKILEEAKLELQRVYSTRPKLTNEKDYNMGMCGVDSCEICGTTIPYKVILPPGNSQHLWCSKCEDRVKVLERRIETKRK